MKVVVLAGGLGSRFGDETARCPKPLIEVGGKPIIWHVLMQYSHYGFSEFIIALGYRGDQVKAFFANHLNLMNDVTLDFRRRQVLRTAGLEVTEDGWLVDLVDTGLMTATGGRIRRLAPAIRDETFMLTFCDGVSNLDLMALLRFHKSHGKLATVTAVRPPPRFGKMEFAGDMVSRFVEKPLPGAGFEGPDDWISGGFFVLEPGVLDYISDDDSDWSRGCLPALAADGQLMAFKHGSFWQCMDNAQDRSYLESLWQAGNSPWKTWCNGSIGRDGLARKDVD